MIVKLLTAHHLEFLSLKGGCRGSSESTLVKITNCWKSHAVAHMIYIYRIQRFSVIPLSTNSGLIGWVPHTDTLHSLIRDYREKKKILLNIEHRLMLRVSTTQYPA